MAKVDPSAHNKKVKATAPKVSKQNADAPQKVAKPGVEKLEDGTVRVTIIVTPEQVATTGNQVIEELSKQVTMPGFRQGKAPKDLAAGQINPETVREEILKKLLPAAYMKAVEENNLRPIMNPQMHVESIEEGKDWVFHAMTAEMPEIDPGNYKDAVQKLTAKSKIVIPGKEEENKKPSLDQVLKAILDGAKVKVPDVLIQQEADRLLSQLLNDIKKLGLSLDQYLGTTNRKPEDLRAEYAKRAEDDIKLEFVLQKIAELEKISVDATEIEEAIQKAKDPTEKQQMESNRYLLAGILRQQKTLDLLMNL